jgi:hypothetical protein
MKIQISALVVLAMFVGCSTNSRSPVSRLLSPTPEERRESELRHAESEKRHAAEREADEQKHAAEERRHTEEDLRHKYAKYSTAELKLMDTRYKELRTSSGRDLNLNVGMQRKMFSDSDTENIERVLEIERELLRRWKAGDKEAYLPEFESSIPMGEK